MSRPIPFTRWFPGMTRRLREAGLPDGPPMQVLLELLSFWNGADSEIFPSRETIASMTGYDVRTVGRGFRAIRKSGLMGQRPWGGGTNHWIVTPRLRMLLEPPKDE